MEKLRQQLYPNLNTSSILLDGSGDATIVGPVELGTINEDVELTDDQTQNDLTAGDEDETSEAIADSEEEDDDDEDEDGGGVRGSNRRQDKDDDDDRVIRTTLFSFFSLFVFFLTLRLSSCRYHHSIQMHRLNMQPQQLLR